MQTLPDRFWRRVLRSSDPERCWLWTGSQEDGYGRLFYEGRRIGAHRVALILTGHALQPSDIVHHRCHTPACVNPRHLEILVGRGVHSTLHAKWTKETILSAIQSFAEEFGHPPRATDWNPALAESRGEQERARRSRDRDWPNLKTVQAAFGSWANAIEAAGFPRPRRGVYPRPSSQS